MGYRRILLLNRIHIGDCLFTTPAIRALREAFPQAWIVAAIPNANADLLSFNPCVDELMWRPVHNWLGKLQFIHEVRRRRFDLIVSFQEKSVFYGLAAHFARAQQTVSLEHWRTYRLYRRTLPWPHDLHRVERYLTLAVAAGATPKSRAMELHVSEAARARAWALLRERGVGEDDRLVGLNPGSTEVKRRWPPARFAEVGDRLAESADARVLLFGSHRDRAATAEIASRMRAPVVDLAGETRLLETAAALEQCALFISGDTGPLHMAAAVGTPVVAMFGPSHPHLAAPDYGVPGGRSRVLQHPYSCGVCPGPCLHTITAEECWAAAIDLLSSEARPVGRARIGEAHESHAACGPVSTRRSRN